MNRPRLRFPDAARSDEAGTGHNALRLAAPAAVTLLALASGFAGLVFAARGEFAAAVACVFLAALFDAMDGRLARALGGGTRFGAELDSLADVVCFGALPAFLLHQWMLTEAGVFGFIAATGLVAAAALRLARFNVMLDDPDRPRWKAGYFVGVPAPAGALLSLTPVYLVHAGWYEPGSAVAVALWTLAVAGLMVSRWPTFSGKMLGLRASRLTLVPPLVLALAAALGLAAAPWQTLSLLMGGYLLSLPVSWWRHAVLTRRQASGRLRP
jgi:CDP-diacylglycerol--serine O-phosphatidyltransferase